MNIQKINKKLAKKYPGAVIATYNEKNNSIVLNGELQNWQDVVEAGYLAVVGGKTHVVNKIKCPSVQPEAMTLPTIEDSSLDNLKPDVLVIGGGIIGAAVLRELSKWQLKTLLVEKESDLAMQASGRNDGEVHPGVDQSKKNLKLKYELQGNKMFDQLCSDLGVPFNRCGQYVAFKGKGIRPFLEMAAAKKRKLGVTDTRVISKKELYEANPNLKKGYHCGLYNASAGVVCPYGLTIAYGENAVENGAEVSLNTAVLSMEVKDRKIISVKTNRGTIYPKVVVNAAGVFSDRIAAMAQDEFFSIHPRKGTDAILDLEKQDLTDTVISARDLFKMDKHTKGGGVMRTVHGNILLGPTAVETCQREDYSTDPESIQQLFNKQRNTFESLHPRDIITYFSGVRASNYEEDFIIEKGRETDNIVHAAAIQSPGLTAAPAIALEIEKLVLSFFDDVKANETFNPIRKPIPVLKEMSDDQRNRMIQSNPDYGTIVCRCEEISKGEIIDCLKSKICVPTLDGIKRRVRPGMGRCQGGFCSPVVSKIIAEYQHKELSDVTKNGGASKVTYGWTK